MSFPWRLVFALIGGLAIFSLVYQFRPFALAPHADDVLWFYRAAIHPVPIWIATVLGLFSTWKISLDATVLYLLAGIALYGLSRHHIRDDDSIIARTVWSFMVVLWPLAIVALVVWNTRQDRAEFHFRTWLLELTKSILAFAILFGANAIFANW